MTKTIATAVLVQLIAVCTSDNLDSSEPSGSNTASVNGTPSQHSSCSGSQESEDSAE